MNTKKLVRRAKKGNKDDLLKLIMNEKDDYYRLAYSYMKNEDDAMNCLQDMIIKLYEKIDMLKDDGSFYTWSKTILVNICKDELKRSKKIIPMEDYQLIDEGIEDNTESDMEVDELLSKIEPIYSELIRFKHILGYDYKTISEIFDIPIGTVKSRIHNGLKKLELVLEEDGKDAR